MLNIGPTSRTWLAEVGIATVEDLRRAGVVTVWRMVKERQPKATLNLLWGLEGAATGRDWRAIDTARKAELKQAALRM